MCPELAVLHEVILPTQWALKDLGGDQWGRHRGVIASAQSTQEGPHHMMLCSDPSRERAAADNALVRQCESAQLELLPVCHDRMCDQCPVSREAEQALWSSSPRVMAHMSSCNLVVLLLLLLLPRLVPRWWNLAPPGLLPHLPEVQCSELLPQVFAAEEAEHCPICLFKQVPSLLKPVQLLQVPPHSFCPWVGTRREFAVVIHSRHRIAPALPKDCSEHMCMVGRLGRPLPVLAQPPDKHLLLDRHQLGLLPDLSTAPLPVHYLLLSSAILQPSDLCLRPPCQHPPEQPQDDLVEDVVVPLSRQHGLQPTRDSPYHSAHEHQSLHRPLCLAPPVLAKCSEAHPRSQDSLLSLAAECPPHVQPWAKVPRCPRHPTWHTDLPPEKVPLSRHAPDAHCSDCSHLLPHILCEPP